MSVKRQDLRKIWDSLFLESGYSMYNEDVEIQGFFLLIEGILVKMKGLAVDWSEMKSHNEKLLVELHEAKAESKNFKEKLERSQSPCQECTKLTKELSELKKSAHDAQKRMNSIAKILKLGDSDSSQTEKNSALNLVTQMLCGNSPKNKKRYAETEMPDSPKTSRNIVIPDSYANQIQLKSPSPKKSVSPKKITPLKRNFSTTFPLLNTPKKCAKKNLTTDFDDEIIDSSPQKPLSFSITPILNDSLLDYVKTNNSQLEKIWFNEDQEKVKPSPKKTEVRAWSLKDRSGIAKEKNHKGQRLKQLKLGIKHFKKDTIDLSKFNKDDEIIEQSPETSRKATQSDTTLFKPLASSTQKPSGSSVFSDIDSSPDFVYKRDAVRKKAERRKLKGWECEECEKYYAALGDQLSPSKIQERMNACSRHRSKFKLTNGGTPPEFWNPLFPDSQDCKDKGLYESVYAPK